MVWNCRRHAENARNVSNTIACARGGSMSDAPSPQGILPTAPRSAVRRWLSRTVAVLYGLVMFEVIIMISPFAFYFYAAYGPTLKWLNHSRATAWLTGFVLPHAGGRAANANSSSRIRRVHAWHGHVPAG